MDIKTIRYRLANDFQLAVVTLLGMIALLGISPFTALRAINGQWYAFAVDLLIQIGILGSVLRAWLTDSTLGPSLFLAYFIGTMAVVAVFVLGTAGEYWFYPAIVANFFLVDRRHALAIALFGLSILLLTGSIPMSTAEAASFVVTAMVCALLSYAFAYRTAVQRNQLETLAAKDALTEVLNRRTLLDELERAHHTFAREGHACGIIMLDLDHFKRINDCHGHQAGDRILIDFARLLERNVRKGDRIFRYGGEEFIVLALQASPDGMMALAEKLRVAIEGNIKDLDGQPVTVSIGVALAYPGETTDAWFGRADAALYAAKNAGRNRVIVAQGE